MSLTLPDHVVVNANDREMLSLVATGGAVHCVRANHDLNYVSAEIVTLDLETECFTMNHLSGGVFCDMERVWELDWDVGNWRLRTKSGVGVGRSQEAEMVCTQENGSIAFLKRY
ncbi:hypothetical protein C2S52_003300 [Perilla frutescens var. hirtella]|uniref:Uncharacterized protein n=1 Tax=Perilla frutescens var. hirtella TaxID=608512 RepID=A0AAD4JCQ6_PERFH|nr:hypothetical protein C2S51_012193 [Perilla frutescens var. frutescens]KAH6792823.1 hypothetical protein C2S52_003300 [Perilla frutescens var. hirtella]KAH6831352.1 hypothetical protein C2S53_011949 [Perilla frutescens var. hirtella]